MDLTLTPEQRLLQESARAFLAKSCPLTHVRAMERDARGFDRDLWRRMAALGWTGMALPEPLGGSGRSFLDVALLLEEMGRALLPSPFQPTCVVAAPLLLALADEDQQRRWLPRIVSGELIATLALVEPAWRDEWGEVAMTAEADRDAFSLSGTKRFVPFAPDAELMLVVVRSADGTRGDSDATMLLAVEPAECNVACARLETFGGEPLYDVDFSGTRAPRAARLGAPAAVRPVLDRARQHAAVAALSYMVGAAERALELTVDYAKTRAQFGRPIGSFQAVAHRCVDMRSDVDALRYLVYQAAWTLAEQRPADLAVSAAKAYGNDALRRVFMHAHQVHGAIGFSTEYDLQLFTRRAKAAELQLGSASAHRERVAKAMGL